MVRRPDLARRATCPLLVGSIPRARVAQEVLIVSPGVSLSVSGQPSLLLDESLGEGGLGGSPGSLLVIFPDITVTPLASMSILCLGHAAPPRHVDGARESISSSISGESSVSACFSASERLRLCCLVVLVDLVPGRKVHIPDPLFLDDKGKGPTDRFIIFLRGLPCNFGSQGPN